MPAWRRITWQTGMLKKTAHRNAVEACSEKPTAAMQQLLPANKTAAAAVMIFVADELYRLSAALI